MVPKTKSINQVLILAVSFAVLSQSTITPAWAVQSAEADAVEFEMLDEKMVLDRASQKLSGEIRETFKATLSPGQGFIVEFIENKVGLGKFAGYLSKDGQFWIPYWDSDGYCVSCNSFYKLELLKSAVFGVDGTPVIGIINWQKRGKAFQIEVQFSSDLATNARLLKRIEGDKTVGRMGFDRAEKVAPQLIPEDQRIAAWAKLWSEVKYNFVYFDQVPDLNWDAAFAEDLPKIKKAKTNAEYFRVLQRRMAMLRDGHSQVYGDGILPSGAWLPFSCYINSANQVVIRSVVPAADIPSVKRRSEIQRADLKSGEWITHVDGQPIEEFLRDKIYPFISASTDQWRDIEAMSAWHRGAYHSTVELTIRGQRDEVRQVVMTRSHYRSHREPKPEFELLDGKVAYIRLSSFSSDLTARMFESHLDEIRKSKGLIIDLRTNGGGDGAVGARIIGHLIDEPIRDSAWKTRKYVPALRAWGKEEEWHVGDPEWIQPAEKSYLGPIVLLVGPGTFSAAEDFTVALHHAKRATVFGNPTGGSTGQPLRIQLPGGGSARICCKRDTYPDGREFVGYGIKPDVLFDSQQDDRSIIQAAMKFLREQN